MLQKVLTAEEEVSHSTTNLVIRNLQAKSTISHVKGDEQRDQLFHTKCQINDKWCSMVIDGGSCTNIASEELVTKLGLTTTEHPDPYDLHWLEDGDKIWVTKQVRLNITMGPYQDTILCDVLPMSACHVLLGRPWQFDRDVTHRGRTNEYELKHKGKRIILKPMSAADVTTMRTRSRAATKLNPLTSEKEVETALEGGDIVDDLVAKENSKKEENMQDIGQKAQLLGEYQHVLPKDLTPDLFPKQVWKYWACWKARNDYLACQIEGDKVGITVIKEYDKRLIRGKLGVARLDSCIRDREPKKPNLTIMEERVGRIKQQWITQGARADSWVKEENSQKAFKAWRVVRVPFGDKKVGFDVSNIKAGKLKGNLKLPSYSGNQLLAEVGTRGKVRMDARAAWLIQNFGFIKVWKRSIIWHIGLPRVPGILSDGVQMQRLLLFHKWRARFPMGRVDDIGNIDLVRKTKPQGFTNLTIRTSLGQEHVYEDKEPETNKSQGGTRGKSFKPSNVANWKAKTKKHAQGTIRAARKGHGFRFLKPRGCSIKSHNGLGPTSRVTKHKVRGGMRRSGKFTFSELRTIPFKGGGNDTNMGIKIIQRKKVVGKGGEKVDEITNHTWFGLKKENFGFLMIWAWKNPNWLVCGSGFGLKVVWVKWEVGMWANKVKFKIPIT